MLYLAVFIINEKLFVEPIRILLNPIGYSNDVNEIFFIFVNRSLNL